MMKNIRFILFALFSALATAGFSQESLDLNECMVQAFRNSRLLKMADLSVQIATEKLASARAQRLPTLAANGMYMRVGKVTSFTIPIGGRPRELQFGTPNRMNAEIKAQWHLFTWGRISNSIALSENASRMSEEERKQKALELTDQVLRAYYAVLLNREMIRVNEMTLERANRHLELAEKRYQSGHAPRLELLRARVQSVNAKTNLEETKANLKKSNLWLAKVIGREGDHVTAKGTFEHTPIHEGLESLIEKAYARRRDLQILKWQKDLSRNQIALASSGNKPNLFAFSGYSVQNGFNPMNPSEFVDNWNVGFQLSIPLFDGGLTKHRVQEAQLELVSAELREKEIKEMIALQIRQAMVSLKQAEAKIAAQKENISFAKEALASAEEQYEKGLISSLDVIDAQQNLTRSEGLYIQTIFNHIMAKIDLCQAIGDYSWFEGALK